LSSSWFAMQSKPNREEALHQQLVAKDVEVFYPWIRVTPVNPRSRKKRPYFPGYLFVNVDFEKIGASLLQYCPFAKGLVSFDREPAPVSEVLIGAIRRKVDEINATGGDSYAGLEPGVRVHIHSGPFAGYDAIFDEKLPGRERVRVLLMLLNDQYRKLDLQVGQIKPV
jgi:transcription antitermination factor NusG